MLALVAVTLALVAFPAPAVAQTTGLEKITIVIHQDSSQDQPIFSRVVATGVFNAVGTDVFLDSPEGDPASYSRYEFPDGTLTVRNTPEQEDISVNPRTCVGQITASGTWEVLEGTGAYAGAEGSGTLTVSGTLLIAREEEGCSQTDATFIGVIRIRAQVTLPTAA